jgi:hypothetical protein
MKVAIRLLVVVVSILGCLAVGAQTRLMTKDEWKAEMVGDVGHLSSRRSRLRRTARR